MRSGIVIFIASFLINQLALSQTQGLYDSLETARQLMNENSISKAILILRSCEKSYPDNVHVIRLHGQALYWSKDFEATHSYFRASIERNPHLHILNLDYGRVLFELSQLDEAKSFLDKYLKSEPESVEANLMLGKIAYWQGKRPIVFMHYLSVANKKHPSNQEVTDFINEVRQSTSPYLKIGFSKYSDSQPLESTQTSLESGFYHSAWLQPGILFQNRLFSEKLNGRHFEFYNKTAFPKSKTVVSMRLGVFQNSWTTQIPYTAGIEIRQNISNNFEIAGNIDRSPYLYTLRSLTSNIMQTNYTASVGRETGAKFKGKVTFRHQQFEDNNYVQWFSVWTLYPIVTTSAFQLDIGYAFLSAWSKENRFVPGNPGVYDPYFTPQRQIVNSLLAKSDLRLGSAVTISFNANVGVFSKIDYPEFVEGETGATGHGNPLLPTSSTQTGGLIKVFTTTKYIPLDLKSALNLRLSKKILLSAEYIYFKTIWYDSHTLSASLKMNFWNDKRLY
ncbi:MAG: tetratricopeptide repeat protein [Bacteroidales bacterium]|nr:tetratricopeptide repeat protein [Bacteroidales bacterium]